MDKSTTLLPPLPPDWKELDKQNDGRAGESRDRGQSVSWSQTVEDRQKLNQVPEGQSDGCGGLPPWAEGYGPGIRESEQNNNVTMRIFTSIM